MQCLNDCKHVCAYTQEYVPKQAVCCMKYVPCHRQLFLSLAIWDATSVCVCVLVCACVLVRVCEMPGLMSSEVINRTVKWPRVPPLCPAAVAAAAIPADP